MSNILKCRCHVNDSKRKYIIKFLPADDSPNQSSSCAIHATAVWPTNKPKMGSNMANPVTPIDPVFSPFGHNASNYCNYGIFGMLSLSLSLSLLRHWGTGASSRWQVAKQ
ncbi:hypothetical protein ACLKA6_019812 [Drosophila palustris]